MKSFLLRFARRKDSLAGLTLLLLVMVTAMFGPPLYGVDPWALVGEPMQWPGATASLPLGSDGLGRDVLAGMMSGARISILIGLSSTLVSVTVGIAIGAVAGYSTGWIDDVLMRLTEVFQTIPGFLLVLGLVAVYQPSLTVIIFSISAVSWPSIARLVRGEFLSLRKRAYVQSCILIGMSPLRIICSQIIPNCAAPIIVLASIMVASSILIEAGLAFLGLQDPGVMSWGVMIGNGRASLRTAWFLIAIPGIAIMMTVLSVSLVADGVNDALNPRGAGTP